jgi:hypothetical protein
MKLERGKELLNLYFDDKKGTGIFIGTPGSTEEYNGRLRYKALKIHLRRFKLLFIKDRKDKRWEISFGGHWKHDGKKNEYISYDFHTLQLEDEA